MARAKKLQFVEGEQTLEDGLEPFAQRTYHVQVLHNASGDRRFNRWTSGIYAHVFFDRKAGKLLHISHPELFDPTVNPKNRNWKAETLVFDGTPAGKAAAIALCSKFNSGTVGWAERSNYGRYLDKERVRGKENPIRARVVEVNEAVTKELIQ